MFKIPAPGCVDIPCRGGPLKLADQGIFWVGATPSGGLRHLVAGQMFVQYPIPAQALPHPVVLIHGGGGQMLHYFGSGDGRPDGLTII